MIAAGAEDLVGSLASRPGRSAAESLSAEVLPLADACRFLERDAARLLAPRRLGRRGRPAWLFGVDAEVRRDPFGVVLVVAPSNYPLLLPGVQAIQALVAGNAVLVKPAPGCSAPMERLGGLLAGAGLPDRLFQVLGEASDAVADALDAGIDKLVLTGSAATGRVVGEAAARHLVPSTMELSGNDAVFVLPGAEPTAVARALAFGLRFNGSATCIAPRRVFVPREAAPALEEAVRQAVAASPPVPVALPLRRRLAALVRAAAAEGARPLGPPPDEQTPGMTPLVVADARPEMALLQEELFAPILSLVPVTDVEDALAGAARSPYALGASIFGPEAQARALALRVDAGTVTVNDLIAPTADPRLPFGGRHASGWGVTRGAEGLLEMTRVKSISVNRGRLRPHFDPPGDGDEALLLAALELFHGGLAGRAGALPRLAAALRQRRGR
ncbi:acyl-CoA reductase-like NAD-dependent aldehyde dehydrogenase [Azospirillum picis]|uniref:Acyl-CoA reductase-like NAD-dependent aldehyde dehydrogenase n=2 Tax=Azospirillum picis TaxID=488438 RepID=A0ABU0MMY3_9PROT|nr:acyl-CoA reductase-like NAD-dependent aldehyde dehydrogenase [Azospirillum picis]MDQ0534833.1 acyl-CoA reductase-like NAD-dependent aldehyde dehydrogenase [Azospirillum picis]